MEKSIQKEILLQTTKTWDNANYQKLEIEKPEITVLKINIGVGQKLPMHKHDMINVAYIIQGTLTVTTDKGEQITIHKGESLPEIVGKYHYGENTGKEPVEMIVFYIGDKGTPLSVNEV